jgi:hypothetical protein
MLAQKKSHHVDDEALVVTRHATDTGRVEWSRAWGSGCLSWPEQPQGTPLLREHARRAPLGRLALRRRPENHAAGGRSHRLCASTKRDGEPFNLTGFPPPYATVSSPMPPHLYAFDVDHTLEVSGGPVPIAALRALREEGHIVGLCGNWAVFVRAVPEWHRMVSFVGPFQLSKADFLIQLRLYMRASEHVMVGNDPATGWGNSADREAAEQAGWRFIREADFAAGAR